ncbi:MAG: MurR/RpiR family transcriptional regulator [Eubacterium sp.]
MKSEERQELRDIFSEIKERYQHLSKSHKKIAAFVMKNYERAPDMSAIKVAQNVKVSEATVVRFALSLGYEGYPEFRKALKNEMNSKLTTIERINMSLGDEEKEKLMQRSVAAVLKSDVNSINETLESFDYESFKQCVDLIRGARKVVVIGFRTTSLLTEHAGYYLNLILEDVRVINHGVTDIYEHLIKIDKEDVVIAMSFPRYAQKTYEAIKFLKNRGPKIITISDSDHAPINEFADQKLIAKSNVYSFVDSLVAPLSLINALVVAIGFKNIKETKQTFNELEEIWKEHYTYTGDEFVKDL